MKHNILALFFPFLKWLPMVNRNTIKADLMAGLTNAVIVLPQGIAFATIAGLPPEYGLYTAMITPVIAGLFGSSLHLISGPTTAISIVVFSTISGLAEPGTPEYINLALTLTFLAGVYQFTLGLARMGSLVNFVSHTVVVAFTAGAAVLIATSQMKHVLGIEVPRGESFLHVWELIFHSVDKINPYVVAVAAVTLAVSLLTRRLWRNSPYLLFGLVAGTVVNLLLGGEQHGVKLVPEIPASLPPLSSPDFDFATIRQLAPQAFAVALLGLIEAVSIARSIASKSQQRIDGNQEFIGQGLSNMIGSFFSSYAGSGSFTRSGINYAAGAKTPMSAIFAAGSLMLIVLLIAPLTAYLPVAAMGGVILIVAWNLIDFHHIKTIAEASKSETSVMVVTFLATLFLELEFAIYAGVMLSLFYFLSRTSSPNIVTLAPDPSEPKQRLVDIQTKPLLQCPQLRIIRIDMSIYFGSIDSIVNRLTHITDNLGANHILIIGGGINFVDVAGAEMLAQEAERLRKQGGGLYLCDLKPQVLEFLARGHYVRTIGGRNLFSSKKEAIREIYKRLDRDRCNACTLRVFQECRQDSALQGVESRS